MGGASTAISACASGSNSALAPVDKGQLKVGRHPRPGAKSPPPLPPLPETFLKTEDLLAALKQARDRVLHYGQIAKVELSRARDSAKRELTQETYDAAGKVYGTQIAAGEELKKVDDEAAKLLTSGLPASVNEQVKAIQKEAKDEGAAIEKDKKCRR